MMILMLAAAVVLAALAAGAAAFRLWRARRRQAERRSARARLEAYSLHRRYGPEALAINAKALTHSKSPRRQRRLKAIEHALHDIMTEAPKSGSPS